jgi:hypothetical protein
LAIKIFLNMVRGLLAQMTKRRALKYGVQRMESTVFSLDEARLHRRLRSYRERLDRVLSANQHAISRLFQTGNLFTKEGTRAGRDLLLAHQHLLRVVTLLDRLSQTGDVPAPKQTVEVDAIFGELDDLLEKTGQLTEKTGALFRG